MITHWIDTYSAFEEVCPPYYGMVAIGDIEEGLSFVSGVGGGISGNPR